MNNIMALDIETGRQRPTDRDGDEIPSYLDMDADGDGTMTVSAATTQSGAIGSASLDLGVLNVNAATTFAVAHAKDINISAATDFAADVFADTIDLTGATTTLTMGDKLTTATGVSSVVTMNATGQKVILDGADIIAGQITAATDGFGTEQITADNDADNTGTIGTSTTLKVGTLDVDKDADFSGDLFVDTIQIDDAEVLSIIGDDQTITAAIDGDGAVEGNIIVNSGSGATKIATFTGNLGATAELKLLTLTTEATFEGSVKVDNIDLAAATAAVFKSDLTLAKILSGL